MMEIEKRNQSLLERSPILESRRPPSPRVFYPGSPGQSAQSESPSFISDQSPRGGGQSAPVTFDQSRTDVRKDLFNKNPPAKDGESDSLERPKPPCPVDESTRLDGVRTFDYRPHTVQPRVEHFSIFEKLIFAVAFRIWIILMEHIEEGYSLESKLFLFTICSIRILYILEVIAKQAFQYSKNAQP